MHVQTRGRGSGTWGRCVAGFSQVGMIRRSFLSTAARAAAFSAGTRGLTLACVTPKVKQRWTNSRRGLLLKLQGDCYGHHPLEFSQGAWCRGPSWLGRDRAGGGRSGGERLFRRAPLEYRGCTGAAFTFEGTPGPGMAIPEWATRPVPIARSLVPGLLAAARCGGVQVIRVAPEFSCVPKYPSYGRTVAIAGPEPSEAPAGPRSTPEPYRDSETNRLPLGPHSPEGAQW